MIAYGLTLKPPISVCWITQKFVLELQQSCTKPLIYWRNHYCHSRVSVCMHRHLPTQNSAAFPICLDTCCFSGSQSWQPNPLSFVSVICVQIPHISCIFSHLMPCLFLNKHHVSLAWDSWWISEMKIYMAHGTASILSVCRISHVPHGIFV